MDRYSRMAAVGLLAAGLLATAGCMQALTTAAYLIKGTNVEAEYEGLKGKRVAVVCRPPVTMNTDQAVAARELAERVSYLLQENVRKIEVIDQQEIANWTDENSWEDFTEIGRAVEAELVLGIELEGFSLFRSASVYQGRADIRLAVYDVEQDGRIAWEKVPSQIVYPPSGGVPISRRQSEFRRQYVDVLGEAIGEHFYPHDKANDFATDSSSLPFH